ncbi:MAG: hypothetical protein Sapg2KO_51270 [Saprospiraceae bacterium]
MDNHINYNKAYQGKSITIDQVKRKVNTVNLRKQFYLTLGLLVMGAWIALTIANGVVDFNAYMICTFIITFLLIFKSLDQK